MALAARTQRIQLECAGFDVPKSEFANHIARFGVYTLLKLNTLTKSAVQRTVENYLAVNALHYLVTSL